MLYNVKWLLVIILAGALGFLGLQTWRFNERIGAAEESEKGLAAELLTTRSENAQLRADYEYFREEENLEKELRGRFNYRLPDEKMIVIVSATSSPSNTTPR